MEKIHILKTTVCDLKDVEKGQTIEATDRNAAYLVSLGKAEYVEGSGPPATEEAKPARRGRRAR